MAWGGGYVTYIGLPLKLSHVANENPEDDGDKGNSNSIDNADWKKKRVECRVNILYQTGPGREADHRKSSSPERCTHANPRQDDRCQKHYDMYVWKVSLHFDAFSMKRKPHPPEDGHNMEEPK